MIKDLTAQSLLAGFALFIMGTFGGALIFHAVPQENRELMIYILGAVSGALTVGPAAQNAKAALGSLTAPPSDPADPTPAPGAAP